MVQFFIMLTILSTTAVDYSDTSAILRSFEQPPRTCSQVPFWFWNGPLDAEQLREQLREMRNKGVYAAMPHPRFGMDRRQFLERNVNEAVSKGTRNLFVNLLNQSRLTRLLNMN